MHVVQLDAQRKLCQLCERKNFTKSSSVFANKSPMFFSLTIYNPYKFLPLISWALRFKKNIVIWLLKMGGE